MFIKSIATWHMPTLSGTSNHIDGQTQKAFLDYDDSSAVSRLVFMEFSRLLGVVPAWFVNGM